MAPNIWIAHPFFRIHFFGARSKYLDPFFWISVATEISEDPENSENSVIQIFGSIFLDPFFWIAAVRAVSCVFAKIWGLYILIIIISV